MNNYAEGHPIFADSDFFARTGFDLDAQIELIKRETRQSPESRETKERIAQQTKSDLEGLYFEYLAKSPLLPFKVARKDEKIVCPQYGNKRLYDITDINERAGSVKQTIQNLEEEIKKAKEGDCFYVISPPGWSGYEGITYPKTQIYCYRVVHDGISSYTLVLNLGLKELENLTLENADILGTPPDFDKNKDSNDVERILAFTSHIFKTNANPHQLLERIEHFTGEDLGSIHELMDNLPQVDARISARIEQALEYIRSADCKSPGMEENIKAEIGRCVLDMKSLVKWGKIPATKEDYQQAAIAFVADDGCNGGGVVFAPTGPREIEYSFDILGVCRLKNCISPKRGLVQGLGPCHICLECDLAIRAKKINPIYENDRAATMEIDQYETKQYGNFASLVAVFLLSLWSK